MAGIKCLSELVKYTVAEMEDNAQGIGATPWSNGLLWGS